MMNDRSPSQRRFLALWSWLPLAVMVLGILSGITFWWLNHLRDHYRQAHSLVDAVQKIDRQVSLFNLWLHEEAGADATMDEEKAWQQFADAFRSADILLRQIHHEKEGLLHDEYHADLEGSVRSVKGVLAGLNQVAVALLRHRDDPAAQAPLKQQFDALFQGFQRTSGQAESMFQENSLAHMSSFISIFRLVSIGWVLLVLLITCALMRVEWMRLRTVEALAESEKRFRAMADSALDAIVYTDDRGIISYWNRSAERLFGCLGDEAVGRDLCSMLLPSAGEEAKMDCRSLWKQGQEGGGGKTNELLVRSGDGVNFPVEVSVSPVRLANQWQNIAILRDISERKQTETALRENEAMLRSLINAMPDFVCFKDGEGRWLLTNDFGLTLFGLEAIAYRGKTDLELAEYSEFYHPVFLGCVTSDNEAWREGGICRCDEVVPRPDGTALTFDVIKVPLFNSDGSRKGLVIIGREISGRKEAEAALRENEERLRHLSSRLFAAQEQERQRIATELHDELGQSLAALKMQVRAVQRQLAEAQLGLRQDCEGVCEYINQIIENVRRLSRDLSPVVLDDLGLSAAIKHLVDNFAELHGVEVSLAVADINHLFPPEAERIVYRILQETLTNIAKHADATLLVVTVSREEDGIRFVVRDDGLGFDVEAMARRRDADKGLGLAAMAERVRMLGGSLDIVSQAGNGTTITMVVPILKS
ncbi:MAG: PAS domain-containing sensor histidine kinase [Desulfobulbaceae bacterium]|nr:PAS domain-containing sensor histidine kinase [Desulfobulbaceae bacterium]